MEETNKERLLGQESFVTPLSLSIMFGMLIDSDTTFLVLASFFDNGFKALFDKNTYTIINKSNQSTIFVGQRKGKFIK